MRGKKPEPAMKRSLAALVALLFLAPLLAPSSAAAQTSSDTRKESSEERAKEAAEKRKREAAARLERTQAQQREAAENRKRQAADKRQRAAAQRERQAAEHGNRERWERQEIVRRQNAMRDADNERAAARVRQNAEWERDMQRRRDAAREGAQPAASGPYSLPGSQLTPARPTAPAVSASSATTCSANPFCPAAKGYGNVCKSVKRSYSGAGAAQTGLRDIVSRCQAANAPDPCNTDARPSLGGGCAQQCAAVAACATASAR